MKTVLVTGSSGFIGKNLCAQLEQDKNIEVLRFNKQNTFSELRDFVFQSDFIFHLAGINRPINEDEFDKGNRELTESIVNLIKDSGKDTGILITSSTQAELNNPYGKSKKDAEAAILKLPINSNSKVYIYRLPNVFGKWSKPNYNSVVSTFCHNIANGLNITIDNPTTELTLVYIDDVIREFINTMLGKKKSSQDHFYEIPRSFKITLRELANKLKAFKSSRDNLLVPALDAQFDQFLYATYISYLDEKEFSYSLNMKHDERGWLTEFIKSESFGQVFISRTKPGITRGNHWHHTKIEKFLVIKGEAEIRFRNYYSREVHSYKVNDKELKVLDIPVGYTHSIKNVGKSDLVTIFWADEIFNPEEPDTYYLEV